LLATYKRALTGVSGFGIYGSFPPLRVDFLLGP
jgi:hypothetical protein